MKTIDLRGQVLKHQIERAEQVSMMSFENRSIGARRRFKLSHKLNTNYMCVEISRRGDTAIHTGEQKYI